MTGADVRKLCVAAALVVWVSHTGTARAEPPAAAPSAALPLAIASDTVCPAPDAVGRTLGEMLGLSATDRLKEIARLAHAASGLVVTLEEADGRLLGERTLPLEGTCEELARATAVVLATWLSDAHPEFVPRLAQRTNAETNGANNATDEANVTNGAHAVKPAPATPPKGDVRSSGRLRFESDWRFRVAGAVGASVLPTPVAFAGTVSAAFVPDHGGIGATLRASALTSRERDVSGGKARYFRWPLAAGATLRWRTPSIALELDAGAALGWLHVAGRSFSPDRSADDVTLGPFAVARVLAARGRLQPFAELTGVFWLESSRVYADPTQPSVALSRGEMSLSVGAAVIP